LSIENYQLKIENSWSILHLALPTLRRQIR
jgi:hypothetical protein